MTMNHRGQLAWAALPLVAALVLWGSHSHFVAQRDTARHSAQDTALVEALAEQILTERTPGGGAGDAANDQSPAGPAASSLAGWVAQAVRDAGIEPERLTAMEQSHDGQTGRLRLSFASIDMPRLARFMDRWQMEHPRVQAQEITLEPAQDDDAQWSAEVSYTFQTR